MSKREQQAMTVMRHKGYIARIDLDEEADLLVGEVLNVHGAITFAAPDVARLREEFARSVEVFEDFCRRKGLMIPKPASGKFVVRMTPEQHARAAAAATLAGRSLNAWAVEMLERAAERELEEASGAATKTSAREEGRHGAS